MNLVCSLGGCQLGAFSVRCRNEGCAANPCGSVPGRQLVQRMAERADILRYWKGGVGITPRGREALQRAELAAFHGDDLTGEQIAVIGLRLIESDAKGVK